MAASPVFAFSPLPEGQANLLEFRSSAYEFRLYVPGLFLLVGLTFGAAAWLFFSVPAGDAVFLALGMCCFILGALPRSLLAYRFTGEGVEQADLTGDRWHLYRLLPLAGALGIFGLMVFSQPARHLAWFSLGCGVLLFLARVFLSRKQDVPVQTLAWKDVTAVVLERRRGVLLLRGRGGAAPGGGDILVFYPKGNPDAVLRIVSAQRPDLTVEEKTVVR